jgi:hypothetical protein
MSNFKLQRGWEELLLANARLIAAGPDLVAVVRKLVAAHKSAGDCVAFSEAVDEFIEEARSALSRATGEETA